VDEVSQARSQLNILRGDGHDVIAVGERDKNGTPDSEILQIARELERVLLTHNTEDFYELHETRPDHSGIIAVFRDADPRKNMNYAQIAVALRRLEASGLTIAGCFRVLKNWR
jgi:predicted nuclease of predicted toxin-antitoxin system